MKMIQQFFGAILIMAALSSNLLAGDSANFKFIGFSENGKYLAFEESGEHDGAGGEYATTYFIDIAKNTFAAAPSIYEWGADGEQTSFRLPRLMRYKKSVAANLERFKIVRGNLGKLVAARPISEHSLDKAIFNSEKDGSAKNKMMPSYNLSKIIFTTTEYIVNPLDEEYYELTLNSTKSKLKCEGQPGVAGGEAEGIEVVIKPNINHGVFPAQILQSDKIIPAIRQCPSSYRIEQIWYYEDKLAVFLNYYKPGFEGSDMRYMVVTGNLAN